MSCWYSLVTIPVDPHEDQIFVWLSDRIYSKAIVWFRWAGVVMLEQLDTE